MNVGNFFLFQFRFQQILLDEFLLASFSDFLLVFSFDDNWRIYGFIDVTVGHIIICNESNICISLIEISSDYSENLLLSDRDDCEVD